MLDPQQSLTLPGISYARIYADHQEPGTYYVFASAPKLEVEESGQPAIRILIYVKREGDQTIVRGGQLTLTTVLALSAPESESVIRALQGRAADSSQPVRVLSPQWVDGSVEVRVTDLVKLGGQPTLMGENRCVLQTALNAGQAQSLRDGLGRGLPDARIVYTVNVGAAARTAGSVQSASHSIQKTAAGMTDVLRELTVGLQATRAAKEPIVIEGPLWPGGLEGRVTEIELP